MKQLLLAIFMVVITLGVHAQMHSSLDVIGGYDFINRNSCCSFSSGSPKSRDGYRFGFNFNVRILEKALLKTGIRYAKHGLSTFNIFNFQEKEFINEYYLEVPLLLRYEFERKTVVPYIEAGFSPNIFRKAELINESGGSPPVIEELGNEYTKGYRFRLSTNIALGFNIKMTKAYQLFTQMNLRYFRSIPSASGGFASVSTVNVGAEFGIRRALSFVDKESH